MVKATIHNRIDVYRNIANVSLQSEENTQNASWARATVQTQSNAYVLLDY